MIRYNIQSHVSFALTDDGQIVPNAGFPHAKWPSPQETQKFGGHHAAQPAKGGYSLVIGARAQLKRTIRHGNNVREEYESYYKEGSHLGHGSPEQLNPAQLLNSWCSFTLGDNPKEIPYSDKAALFFHSLLMGMATLNRQIQAATFDQEQLLSFIEQQSALPLLSAQGNMYR